MDRAPKRFAADSITNADAATRGQLERLKAQWRREWEEERARKDAVDREAIHDSIDRKLDLMRERHQAAQALALEWQEEEEGEVAEE